jgi:hypothetical protein
MEAKVICDLVKVEHKESRKDGKPFRVVVLGDAEKYQSIDIPVFNGMDIPVAAGQEVEATLDIYQQGYNLRINLLSIKEL